MAIQNPRRDCKSQPAMQQQLEGAAVFKHTFKGISATTLFKHYFSMFCH
jgi:hypothetical protein